MKYNDSVGAFSTWAVAVALHTQATGCVWPRVAETYDMIECAYTNPNRYYHTLDHIKRCMKYYGWYLGLVGGDEHYSPDVSIALWLHDLVYDSRSKQNEEDSAEIAFALCGGYAVRDAILATKSHVSTFSTGTTAVVLDCDLASLGEPWDTFAADSENIRKEYSWVTDGQWSVGREKVLDGFLQRDRLYNTLEFRQMFEAQARRNLTRALVELRAQAGG